MHRHQKNNRQEPPALRPEPWLVYSHGKQRKSQTFYSLLERRCHVRNIPQLRNRRIWAHSQGWLALFGTDRRLRYCSLFNPATMEEVHLPNFPSTAKSIYNCALSSPPTRGSVNNCLLMCIEYCDQKKQSVFHFCQPGDKDWTTQLVEPQQGQCRDDENAHLFRFHHIVSFNSELYVVSMCCYSLFRVQLMIDKHSINDVSIKLLDLKLRRPDRPWAHFIRSTMLRACFLVQASPTELMGIELHYGDNRDTDLSLEIRVEGLKIVVKKIELYKVNFQEQRWEHVETLPEDTAIFLGSHSDTAVFYKIPRIPDLDVGGLVRGNTVYFMPIRDGYLYAYDVGERSISVSLPCPNANRHDYTEPVWIMPLGCSSSTIGPQREIVAAFRDDRGDHEYEILPDEIGSEQILLADSNYSSTDNGRHWWSDISIDLLSDILSRLFVADRCFFRLACKPWNSVFSNAVSTSSNDQFARDHSFPILIHRGLDGRWSLYSTQ